MTQAPATEGAPERPPRRSLPLRLALLTGALALLVLFCALGVWQVQRLAWKTDLIARVEARLSQPATAAPGPADWIALDPDQDEYRRIGATGRYRSGSDIPVKAVTTRGAGFWVMTPLDVGANTGPDGWTLLVNRGFVPDQSAIPAPPAGPVRVSGLLRLSQPDGAFLRSNDPQAGRWYSRDTAAIARKLGLERAAPYFLDADAAGDPQALPIGGLTVVQFRNSHLGYALTWFGMAALWAGWLIYLWRKPGRG